MERHSMQPYFLVHFEIVLHKVSSSYQRKCFDKLRIGFIITNDDHSFIYHLHRHFHFYSQKPQQCVGQQTPLPDCQDAFCDN